MRASLASQSSRSPKSTSACSPSDTKCEKPMPRPLAQSSIAVTSAPDCDTNASPSACTPVCAKLAFEPACGDSRPRQLGPRMRSRCLRAASSMACFCAASRPAVSDDRGARAACAERLDQPGHGGRRRADHGQLGRFGQARDVGIDRLVVEPAVLGVDSPARRRRSRRRAGCARRWRRRWRAAGWRRSRPPSAGRTANRGGGCSWRMQGAIARDPPIMVARRHDRLIADSRGRP